MVVPNRVAERKRINCSSQAYNQFLESRIVKVNMIPVQVMIDVSIPSYVRGIKYRGIFRSYHPENTPRSSRSLLQPRRQLVCTTHVWVSMAFRSYFSISGHNMKHYFVHNVLLYCNKYLFIPTLYGNLKFHNYSIHTIPYRTRQARSLSRRATQFWEKTNSQDKFTTNINL